MNVNIKPSTEDVRQLYLKHTVKKGDAGLDVFFINDIVVPPKAIGFMIDLGISCEATDLSHSACSFMLVPRSSITKTPLRMSNSVGIIDSVYRGVIKAPVDNLSDEEVKLNKGERLFQIVSGNLGPITFKLVSRLSDTERGKGGFGSTGK